MIDMNAVSNKHDCSEFAHQYEVGSLVYAAFDCMTTTGPIKNRTTKPQIFSGWITGFDIDESKYKSLRKRLNTLGSYRWFEFENSVFLFTGLQIENFHSPGPRDNLRRHFKMRYKMKPDQPYIVVEHATSSVEETKWCGFENSNSYLLFDPSNNWHFRANENALDNRPISDQFS